MAEANIATLDIVELGPDNIDSSHICCLLDNSAEDRVRSATKKDWMRGIFPDGYRFWRLDAKGKAFIEATPGKNAWCPVEAENWLFIDCFWVSGRFKGHGIATRLLAEAEVYAKAEGLAGLVAVAGAGKKKKPFLSDGAFYRHMGFEGCDSCGVNGDDAPYYELLAKPLAGGAALPRFAESAKNPPAIAEDGVVLYFTHHCPHTAHYAGQLADVAEKRGVPCTLRLVQSAAEAQRVPNPFPTWAMFYDGRFITNEIFSEGKFVKFLESNGK